MASYNEVLNTLPEYKEALLRALLYETEFPSYEYVSDEVAVQAASDTHDPLLTVFKRRSFDDITEIMNLQTQRFGSVDRKLFWSVIRYVSEHGDLSLEPEIAHLQEQAAAHTGRYMPTNDTFDQWHNLHVEFFNKKIHFLRSLMSETTYEHSLKELEDIFTQVFRHEGLDTKGWHVEESSKTNLVSIARTKKALLIGPAKVRLSPNRLIGLILHEVYIHIMWAEHDVSPERNLSVQEGIGTLVEQLTLPSFEPLRIYRFLAICLAIGVDGIPRDMRQTYNVVLSIRKMLKKDEAEVVRRSQVAKEVIRVFRSLPPDVPGLVYIRDKYYLEHNVAIWRTLSEGVPTLQRYMSIVAPWRQEI